MSSIDAFTSCAGNDHTVVTCHKAGSLTRSRQTVRRRCGAFWLNDGTAAHPPNCGRLPGNFSPHCKARGGGRAERREKAIGRAIPIARRRSALSRNGGGVTALAGRRVPARSAAAASRALASVVPRSKSSSLDHDREALTVTACARCKATLAACVLRDRAKRSSYPRSRRRSPRSRSPRSRRGGRLPPSKRSSASPSARGISLPVA
jgi:hypothetical protein